MQQPKHQLGSGALIVLSSLVFCGPAAAGSGETGNVCVRDFQPGAVCTANDVRIEQLEAVSVIEDCGTGTIGEAVVVFEMLISADGSPDRYDIGAFLALDGGSALTGNNCFHDYLNPPLTTSPIFGDDNGDMIPDIKDGPWPNLEPGDAADMCGDIEGGTQNIKTLQQLTVACVDNNADGSVDVSVCASWDQNQNGTCTGVAGAFPGTNSKCGCQLLELGIPPEVQEGPVIAVSKTPPSQVILSGTDAVFTITVDNPGTSDLIMVVVTDPDCDILTGPMGDNGDNVLQTTETWTYTCTVQNVTQDFTNVVTVDAQSQAGTPVSDTASADVVVIDPSLAISKDPPFQMVPVGADAVFTISVENTGNADLIDVMIDDPQCTTLTGPDGDDGDGILSPAEVWTYTCTVENVTDDFTNVATATATPPLGPNVMGTATADVEVTEGPAGIPALSGWGLVLLAAVLAAAALAMLSRRVRLTD